VGTYPAGPASRRSSVRFIRLMSVTVTLVIEAVCKGLRSYFEPSVQA